MGNLVTFQIQTRDMYAFTREFAKLVKKAAKLKVEAPTFEVIEKEKVIPAHTIDVVDRDEDNFGRPTLMTKFVAAKVVNVITVSGPAPKLAGWTFVATLQHEEAGNIVRRVPGTEALNVNVDLRKVGPKCDHCQMERRRADTYVVIHDDGRQAQVGRNCLRDFTGHDSPEAIARWAELLSAFIDSMGEDGEGGEGGFGGGGILAEPLDSYLVYVAAAIREAGWMSRTKAREFNKVASANLAWDSMHPRTAEDCKNAVKPNDDDKARAERAIKVARDYFDEHDVDSLSDYEHNLRLVVEGKSVEFRTAGIAASLVNFAERLIGIEIERKQAAQSQHVGEIGKRTFFTLTVIRVIDIDSIYGMTHLHILKDETGNRFKWKASRESLDVGTTYKVKGTIKAHEEYKGVKQTSLSRCVAEKIAA